MNRIHRILLVLDRTVTDTPALARAVALARALKAQLWLGLFDCGTHLNALRLMRPRRASEEETLLRAKQSLRLAHLRKRLSSDGSLNVHTFDDLEPIGAERIVEYVRTHEIDLVIKDFGHEPLLKRLTFLPLDKELVRACPVPLWMVTADMQGLPQQIAVAVDPVCAEHDTAELNRKILDFASVLRTASGARVRVISAFAGLPPAFHGLDPEELSISRPDQSRYDRFQEEHRVALHDLLARHGMRDDDAWVLPGPSTSFIRDALKKLRPDVLVIGTLHRHGSSRLMTTSTFERMIGETTCDLIAVPVENRSTAAPQAHRPVSAGII